MSDQRKEPSELLLERAFDADSCRVRTSGSLTVSELSEAGWRSLISPYVECGGTISGPYVETTLDDGTMPADLVESQNIFHVYELLEPLRYRVLEEVWNWHAGHYMMLTAHVACYHVTHGRLHDELLSLSAEIAHYNYQPNIF